MKKISVLTYDDSDEACGMCGNWGWGNCPNC